MKARDEPGDIIWENLGISKCENFLRMFCFVLFLTCVLGLSFLCI